MEILTAIWTAVLCVLAFLTWRVYKLQAWLSGALESHSLLMLRITAREKSIPAVWWDPDIADPPTAAKRGHAQPADLETIYLYLPQRERSGWRSATRWQKFRRWLNAEIWLLRLSPAPTAASAPVS